MEPPHGKGFTLLHASRNPDALFLPDSEIVDESVVCLKMPGFRRAYCPGRSAGNVRCVAEYKCYCAYGQPASAPYCSRDNEAKCDPRGCLDVEEGRHYVWDPNSANCV